MAEERTPAGRAAGGEATSLSKALRLLRLVAERNATGLRSADLSRRAGLSTTTTHRLVHALVDEGFLSFDPYSRRYFLGADAAALGAASGWAALPQGLRAPLQSVLETVATRTGDTAYLSIRQGLSAVCVAKAQGSFAVSANTLDVGARRPLGVGAGSLALLSAEAPDAAERIVESHAEAYLRYGRLTAAHVRRALSDARRDGFAVNDQLIIEGVGAVAVLLRPRGAGGEDGPVLAISVAAISPRLRPERRVEICGVIRDALARMNLSDGGETLATDPIL
ncbi:MAG: IclR family transcriptional regulator [Alkalilacustris sp.]